MDEEKKPRTEAEQSAGPATEGQTEEGRWSFIVDPAWQPTDDDDNDPPLEAVVGAWFVDADGNVGMFQPNPAYKPSQEDFPTDPVDAAVQLVARGDGDSSELLGSMHAVMYGIALNDEGAAIVAPAPDEAPSLLVTTSPAHRSRVYADNWAELTLVQLADLLPEEGVDVLINPGAPASMRLLASAVKQAAQVPAGGTESERE